MKSREILSWLRMSCVGTMLLMPQICLEFLYGLCATTWGDTISAADQRRSGTMPNESNRKAQGKVRDVSGSQNEGVASCGMQGRDEDLRELDRQITVARANANTVAKTIQALARHQVIFVLAGNMREFQNWCRIHNISPNQARYISDLDRLRGAGSPKTMVFRYGTWYQRRDLDTIEFELRMLALRGAFIEGVEV
jgi:hypothetical protein